EIRRLRPARSCQRDEQNAGADGSEHATRPSRSSVEAVQAHESSPQAMRRMNEVRSDGQGESLWCGGKAGGMASISVGAYILIGWPQGVKQLSGAPGPSGVQLVVLWEIGDGSRRLEGAAKFTAPRTGSVMAQPRRSITPAP